ncbi:uncharacterized protein LOC118766614 isoform X2 [Octopus sinensis]|uniref:Uncharacterized protein LOC118766614 isoform X2 n=1 Tax=Octopus sinensis TaxID=2607531 RepID=A0A7E6FE93_9MOLL|nr:uncharacterized protein LOC118766614 isoform X2 [Octopus sinensis]
MSFEANFIKLTSLCYYHRAKREDSESNYVDHLGLNNMTEEETANVKEIGNGRETTEGTEERVAKDHIESKRKSASTGIENLFIYLFI